MGMNQRVENNFRVYGCLEPQGYIQENHHLHELLGSCYIEQYLRCASYAIFDQPFVGADSGILGPHLKICIGRQWQVFTKGFWPQFSGNRSPRSRFNPFHRQPAHIRELFPQPDRWFPGDSPWLSPFLAPLRCRWPSFISGWFHCRHVCLMIKNVFF